MNIKVENIALPEDNFVPKQKYTVSTDEHNGIELSLSFDMLIDHDTLAILGVEPSNKVKIAMEEYIATIEDVELLKEAIHKKDKKVIDYITDKYKKKEE